jgi:hypothetical protein
MSIKPARSSLDGPAESRQLNHVTTTVAERNAARDEVVRRATSMADLANLLIDLGQDDPDEIDAQLAYRPLGGTA